MEKLVKRRYLKAAALGMTLALAGCAAQTPEVRATRFHLGQPIAPGEFTVEPRDQTMAASLEFDAYAKVVADELQKLNFKYTPTLRQSELVAVIAVSRDSRQTGPARSPISIGLGGGSGGGYGGGIGIGGGVSFPIGKPRAASATRTELAIQLKRRSDSTIFWEGRAMIDAKDGTPFAAPTPAVQRLAEALFKGFPGESGRTIVVK